MSRHLVWQRTPRPLPSPLGETPLCRTGHLHLTHEDLAQGRLRHPRAVSIADLAAGHLPRAARRWLDRPDAWTAP